MTSDIRSDEELAARQWAEWRLSRRRLLQSSGFAAGALTLGGLRPFVRTGAAQDAEPKMGGTIAMSLADDDVQNFDPTIPTDNMSIWTMLLIYDQLIRVGPDGASLEPGLATAWQKSEDSLTYTFTLRDATFHDGTPCTSADVVYSLDRARQGESWSFIFSAISALDAPDPKTVVVTLSQTWAPFEADLALFGASIIPKAAHEAQGEDLFQHPIGTGPFLFDSWDKGAQIVLKKYASYWDQPKPYLDELTFHVLTDANSRMLQFQGGELDIVTSAPFSQLATLKANPDVVVLEAAVARIDYIGLNVTREPLTDVKVRQAINYAVDKDVIIQNVLFGAGRMANTYLPLMYGHDDTIPGYPYNLEQAQALIAETAAKDGFELELLIGTGDPVGSQIAQLVAADLEKIGGKITITQVEPALFTERVHGFDFDMSLVYYTTDIIDPDELTNFAVQSDGGTFAVWTQYKNEQVDALVRQGQAELDPEKRLGIYSEIQKLVSADAHMLYLYYPTGSTVTQSYVKNFSILPTGNYRLWETWRDDV
jgi:peptide/nickel transport system substrate-binding protein